VCQFLFCFGTYDHVYLLRLSPEAHTHHLTLRVASLLFCRFKFPIELVGFKANIEHPEDGSRPYLLRPDRIPEEAPEGAKCNEDNKLKPLRNHLTAVHHIPELLTIWGGNIEGSVVESYPQVIRYLLKYMMKDEPNSKPFNAICKAVVENAEEEAPLRKAFQQILMKTVGQHDFSKQECAHILNDIDFVEISRQCIKVNVIGTRRLRAPESNDTDDTNLAADNVATIYWNREKDDAFKSAVDLYHRHPNVVRDPAKESLYTFSRMYTSKWNLRQKLEKMIPHITPSFKKIPNHSDQKKDRYTMFLRSTLLVHKPGTTFNEISALGLSQLEAEVSQFTMTDECPKLVAEEFEESQTAEKDEE
jgi:hypothetical protein